MNYITKQGGRTLEQAVSEVLKRIKQKLNGMGSTISKVLTSTTRNHISNRFPGSTHYDPDKITEGESKMSVNGATGESIINIPGFSRAWHDITIRPVNAKMLAIPIHREAYGKSPKQFDNLFGVRGKKVLFKNDNGTLVGMFALANSAFQPQDSSIAPSDETYANEIGNQISRELDDDSLTQGL